MMQLQSANSVAQALAVMVEATSLNSADASKPRWIWGENTTKCLGDSLIFCFLMYFVGVCGGPNYSKMVN